MARKKKQPEFYRDGDKYIALTGESPKGFKDFLFICFKGDSPAEIKECVITRDDVHRLAKIDTVPDDWADAFKGAGIEMPERHATRQQEELVSHLAAGTDLYTAAAVSGVWDDNSEPADNDSMLVGIIIGLPVFIWVLWILL